VVEPGLFGQSGAKGDGKWAWELSDVNKAITIQSARRLWRRGGRHSHYERCDRQIHFWRYLDFQVAEQAGGRGGVLSKGNAGRWLEADRRAGCLGRDGNDGICKGDQTATIILSVEDDNTQVMITVEK